MNKIGKAARFAGYIVRTYQQDHTFSRDLARFRLRETIYSLVHNPVKAKAFKTQKDETILKTISGIAKESIQGLETESFRTDCAMERPDSQYFPASPIFACWWSGIENAPEIVQICIKSTLQKSGEHPVVVIDRTNYQNYLDVPGYMIDHVKEGRMGLACFSDYLRFSLLNRYGGLWLDATIYCASDISQNCFSSPLFTCNTNAETSYISNGKWTAFVFGGRKGHPIFRYMQKAFESYWIQNKRLIDYFLVDYLVYLGYKGVEQIKRDIDTIPINNLHRNELAAAMVRGEPSERLNEFIFPDTCFYKLSWREKYKTGNDPEHMTVYDAFLKNGGIIG